MGKEEHREFECDVVTYEDGSSENMCEGCSDKYYKDSDDPDYDIESADVQYTEDVTDIDSWLIDVFDDDEPIPTCDECGCEFEEVCVE